MQEDLPAVGRDAELARLTALIDSAPAHGQVLVVLGDAGMGHAERALAAVDPAESGLIASRAWRALGVAALADGDHFLAFTQLCQLFSPLGTPVHNVFSYPAPSSA